MAAQAGLGRGRDHGHGGGQGPVLIPAMATARIGAVLVKGDRAPTLVTADIGGGERVATLEEFIAAAGGRIGL